MITSYRRPAYAKEDPGGIFRKEVPMLDWMNFDFLSTEMSKMWHGQPPGAVLARYAISQNLYLGSDSFFSKNLRDSVLLDLGAGDPEAMIGFARCHGVKTYCGVDSTRDYSGIKQGSDTLLIKDDLLWFLFHVGDSRVNVCMNAIDECVLRTGGIYGQAYEIKLINEIARVTMAGGIAFGLMSPSLHGLAELGFTKLEVAGDVQVSEFGAVYRKPLV
ncbi:hypothetical protein JXA56_04585 [Candidatus Micrarchaeota archaeon]|nr:hypothetical protein [Candidatus Micrarchaeota archaeon]